MKKLAVFFASFGCVLVATTCHAIDLKASKVTQVVNDVQIISAADQKEAPAAVNEIFAMPDILRTGAASRAELVARDETVTRVGANTIFSFDPANRTIDLKQGSLLFHSPHGKGGGTIHTGSATASVLGTTLIVVTTPQGGFKVIALEGEVEVKFLNGLKQKLDPGQMTFILPGANQLAPVIIFRLDELTQNSLLIRGFTQQLESLPLIQNQIERQMKLIFSGKLGDTGLYAGNNATPNQVEVLDVNTISGEQHASSPPPPQQTPPPIIPPTPPPVTPNLAEAEAADATINQPSLLDASIPTPPDHIFLAPAFPLTGNNFFNGQTFSGFVARNIYVNTPNLSPLVVDLTSWGHLATFDLVAVNDIPLEGSVTFKGLDSTADFGLIAGNQLVFTPGITVEADAHNFLLSSPTAMTLDNVNLINAVADINLNTAADVIFQDNASVNANGRLIVQAGNNISATGSQLTGASALFSSLNGNVSFENTTLNAGSHAIFIAPGTISLDNSTVNADSVTMSGTASTTISINNTTINSPSSLAVVSIGDLNITGTSVSVDSRSAHDLAGGGSALNADPTTGSVSLTSAFGSVNVSGTSITAHYLTLNSGDGILLDGSGQSFVASGSGSTANFTAPNLITVNNADLTSYAAVNMAANTVNLFNVAFGSRSVVNLRSLNGVLAPNPNTGAGSVPGDVNFIQGVTYGGSPAQNYIGNGITIGTLH